MLFRSDGLKVDMAEAVWLNQELAESSMGARTSKWEDLSAAAAVAEDEGAIVAVVKKCLEWMEDGDYPEGVITIYHSFSDMIG